VEGGPQKDILSFLPFGDIFNRDTSEIENPQDTEVPSVNNLQTDRSVLQQLSTESVAGATWFQKQRELPEDRRLQFTPIDVSLLPKMSVGFEGEEVALLENTLTLLLNKEIGMSEKTVFDTETKNLIIAFQKTVGISANGSLGKNTLAKITQKQQELLEDIYEQVPAVRYIQKKDGVVKDIYLDTKETVTVSETIIPRIHEALFGEDENTLVLRYLKNDNETIETFGGIIKEKEMTGTFFPSNIPFLAMSPDKEQLFYLTENYSMTEGVVSSLKNTSKKPLFEHSFSEWIPDWGSDSIITLTTKASFDTPGNVYTLSPKDGTFTKAFGGKKGLTTNLSPNGLSILYGEQINGQYELSVYSTVTKKHKKLSLRTLPEKCTWLSNSTEAVCAVPGKVNTSELPDIWYQGVLSFNDTLWLVDTETSTHQLLINPRNDVGRDMDITEIMISHDESYLFFIDKKTSLLYGMKL